MIYFQLCAEVGEGLCILEVRPNNPVKTTGGDPIVQVFHFLKSCVWSSWERRCFFWRKVGLFLYQQLVIKSNFTIPWLSCGNIHYINWSLKIQTSCLHWIPPLRKHWKLKSCRRDWPKAIFNCSIWVGTFFEIFWFYCVAPLFYTLLKTVLSAFILQKINLQFMYRFMRENYNWTKMVHFVRQTDACHTT